MMAALHYAWLTLRLNFRNRMALIYGFVFPIVFLLAFAVIYRHDPVPVIAHLGKLLTVTALGGACFGLPTAIVSERERGVWRRYRVSPRSAGTFIAGQVASRLILLAIAGTIQVAVAMTVFGMPAPGDPFDLLTVFMLVCIALIGMGMIIAMVAGSVPAVQALGQCVFLPLLMIGGITVPVASLPEWAQTLSAFFPGRYAVSAIQAASTGAESVLASKDLPILAGYALAGAIVAAGLFRWDSSRRRMDWRLLTPGLALWLVLGTAGAVWPEHERPSVSEEPEFSQAAFVSAPPAARLPQAAPSYGTREPASSAASPTPPAAVRTPATWRDVGEEQFATIAFERLPDDAGLVAPMAERGTLHDTAVESQIATVRKALPQWAPAHESDKLQRARNLLYIAAVPDLLQMDPLERHLPWLVFDRLRQDIPPRDLARILYWIAMNPEEGSDSAIGEIGDLGLPQVAGPTRPVRERAMIYALKFLKRLEDQGRAAAQP